MLQFVKNTFYNEMKRQKKINNIFSQPILHQSLFHEEVQKQYKIGGVTIQGTWLKDSAPAVYQSSVQSALELSQLRGQLGLIKKSAQLSPADMFRMAEFQKKMENFQIKVQSPTKKKPQKNEKIYADNLVFQKGHDFWGLFQRNCRIEGKQLIYRSQKQKRQISINLSSYSIELEQKSKTGKESQKFVWPEKLQFTFRMFLFGQNLRPFCVYGQQKVLKNLIKRNKIQSIQLTQIDFFKKLSKQYEQKIFILFGNRLRVYEHLIKQKQKDDLNFAFQLLQKSHLLEQPAEQQQKVVNQKNAGEDSHSQTSSRVNRNVSPKTPSLNNSVSSPLGSPLRIPTNQSQFRKKARRSTINYEDLSDEQEGEQVKIEDFKLQIKQAARSDDQSENAQDQIVQVQKPKLSQQQQSKKRLQQTKRYEQMVIPEFVHEDSMSESSSAQNQMKRNYFKPKKEDWQINLKFQLKEIQFTHYLYIAYFEDFCAYSQPELDFIFFQKMIPQIEYQNMKIPVCTLKKITLKRNNQTNIYSSDKPIILAVSSLATDMGIVLSSKMEQHRYYLSINLKKVNYSVDVSQFIYIKVDNRIHCAGKLKMIASPDPINPEEHQEQSTESFLHKYLIKEVYGKQQKYRFVNYKRRAQQIRQQWNDKMMKRIINKLDQQQFLKAIFFGFPQKIMEKFEQKFKSFRTLSRTETRIQSPSTFFSSNTYSMIQNQVVKMKAYDLRVYIKINKLISIIAQTNKNQLLQKRIDDISTFFNLKYGKASLQKFMGVLVVQILRKIESSLLQLTNSKQIQVFINEYLEVQYEIDSLMESVSAYFN